MTFETTAGTQLNDVMFVKYMEGLVDRFFKILPIKESIEGINSSNKSQLEYADNEFTVESLCAYIKSLHLELLGCHNLMVVLQDDPQFMTLLNILQYFIDYPNTPVDEVRREVFHAISVCNKLKRRYSRVTEAVIQDECVGRV